MKNLIVLILSIGICLKLFSKEITNNTDYLCLNFAKQANTTLLALPNNVGCHFLPLHTLNNAQILSQKNKIGLVPNLLIADSEAITISFAISMCDTIYGSLLMHNMCSSPHYILRTSLLQNLNR